jgi:protein-L-isoaspartate(D-aspartate) O-methyltransferase
MIDLDKNRGLLRGDTQEHFQARKNMIRDQILVRGVRNSMVIRAIAAVPRHRFVNESLEKKAFDDSPLPIGENQTISQPYIVAYMTAALELQGGERILEVGTGSGYQAAVLAEIASDVYTIEINENLAIEVAGRFKKMEYRNIHLRFGDGNNGWPDHSPFDGIVVTAAPNHIPKRLIEQLRIGAKLVIPVGDTEQELVVVTKLSDGTIKRESRIPVRFVPMIREIEKK